MLSQKILRFAGLMALLLLVISAASFAGTLYGTVLDPNWYARPNSWDPYGVGLYEYSVNANAENISTTGGYSATGGLGNFFMSNLPSGKYTLVSWDTWWRSAYVFNVNLGTGSASKNIRLHANMWGYPAFWDPAYRNDFGQTFTASGSSVVMLAFRVASSYSSGVVTFHDGGPNGPQIGPSKTFGVGNNGDNVRLTYNGGQIPTIPGNTYYVKISITTQGGGAVCNMDPIPDYSDPMPGGRLYQNGMAADPRRDLGLTICSDDDGVLTNIYVIKKGGSSVTNIPSVSSVGQTLKARGTSLISAAAWILDDSATYIFKVYDHPGGTQIGTTKRNKAGRPGSGDPEIICTWQPEEVPLVPGNNYYLEVTRDGGGMFSVMASPDNPYSNGNAYINGTMQGSLDMLSTVMEEEFSGSATMSKVSFTADPAVSESNRKTTSLTVTWNTNVTSDSFVEWSADVTPYTHSKYDAAQVSSHSMTITGLKPNTMYHIRAKSARSGYRPVVSRDFVVCTLNDSANLLVNGGFEEGTGVSPRWPIPGWTNYGSLDVKASDGSWYDEIPPRSGSWMLGGGMRGSACDGGVYQRVSVVPGMKYTFSAWVLTQPLDMKDGNVYKKYDVWDQAGRIIYMRLGADPTGGTNPASSAIQWTPRMYSHLRYNNLSTTFTATSNYATVYISMQGGPGSYLEWLLFAVDDCVLTRESTETNLVNIKKNVPGSTSVNFQGAVVTAIPSQAGAYYVELPDRSCGIRVESDSTVTEGSVVQVQGGLTTLATGERALTSASIATTASGTVPGALVMNCKDVGGSAYGQIPAVPGSEGPHNTGLLIKLAGRVTFKAGDNSHIFINDGSIAGYGVRVDTSSLSSIKVPAVDSVVSVTGISTLWKDGSAVKPLLKARRDADMSDKLN